LNYLIEIKYGMTPVHRHVHTVECERHILALVCALMSAYSDHLYWALFALKLTSYCLHWKWCMFFCKGLSYRLISWLPFWKFPTRHF